LWANGNDALGWLQWLNAFFGDKNPEKEGCALSVNQFVQGYLTSGRTFVSFRLTPFGTVIWANAATRLN
jgi:hypothetical protein